MNQLVKRCLILATALMLTGGAVHGQASGPDLVVVDLFETELWGQEGDILGYSIGTEICNLGDEDADWIANSNLHPVIAQNLYRLKDDRMEQVGQSWLKHGFFAVNGSACEIDCQPPGGFGDELGVGCSDPYGSGLNGDQDGSGGTGGLGPRSEVNAATGEFLWPYGSQGQSGDDIYKRLQVHVDDVDPDLNAGARYFIEGQYVTQDDAQAGNGDNNASYREVRVQSNFTLVFEAPTVEAKTAVRAWQDVDPTVDVVDVDVPSDGRMTLAAKVSDLGGGQWHYEYALHNLNSDRSARSFEVPIPEGATVSAVGFHDVDYHSGEPYDLTDWTAQVPGGEGGTLSWSTTTHDVDPDANALRWGTMYNFRFDADLPPEKGTVTIGLFKPGDPESVTAGVLVPVGAGGIPCADVMNFQTRCIMGGPGNRLQWRAVMTDTSHDGEAVTVEVDGVPDVVTINGRRAMMSVNGAAPGVHTVELVDPAGCFALAEVTCP